MHDTAARIRDVLSTAGTTAVWQAIELALTAAGDVGRRAIANNPLLPPADQLALALEAAVETLKGIGLRLAGGEAKLEV
jgi:hypothetical protein